MWLSCSYFPGWPQISGVLSKQEFPLGDLKTAILQNEPEMYVDWEIWYTLARN